MLAPNTPKGIKERGKVFSPAEVDLLISIIEKYVNVLENKKSDSQTWQEKQKAWKKATDDFNAAGIGVPRTHIQLMNKYNILKRNSRKEYAALKSELNKTGGGEYKPTSLSDISIKIHSLSELSISGGTNDADCYTTEHCDEIFPDGGAAIMEPIVIVIPSTSSSENPTPAQSAVDENSDVLDTHDWANYSPALLKRPKHVALATKKRPSINKQSIPEVLSNEKKQLIEIQKKYFVNLDKSLQEEQEWKKQEHSFKMKCMEEEHEWKNQEHSFKMKCMEEEHEWRRQQAAEEHAKKMAN